MIAVDEMIQVYTYLWGDRVVFQDIYGHQWLLSGDKVNPVVMDDQGRVIE